MMTELAYRIADPDDIHAIAQLITAEDVLNLWPGRGDQIDVVEALEKANRSLSAVKINGRLVAMLKRDLWSLALWVRPEDRRTGIGSGIIRDIIAREEKPAFVVHI
jgi:predicted N-acetyltransferase YhbS